MSGKPGINKTHGHSGNSHKRIKPSPTYNTWAMMRQRCSNPNTERYEHYGGRGIKVCARWDESFENFLADMGERPPGMSLDRINVDGDYEKSNCRWATMQEQLENARSNVKITLSGRTLTVSQWARATGISRQTIFSRLRRKWPPEEVLRTPLGSWSTLKGSRFRTQQPFACTKCGYSHYGEMTCEQARQHYLETLKK